MWMGSNSFYPRGNIIRVIFKHMYILLLQVQYAAWFLPDRHALTPGTLVVVSSWRGSRGATVGRGHSLHTEAATIIEQAK